MSQVQFLGSWSQGYGPQGCGSRVPVSQVQGLVSQCSVFQGPESQSHRFSGLRVWVLEFLVLCPKSQVQGSKDMILDSTPKHYSRQRQKFLRMS